MNKWLLDDSLSCGFKAVGLLLLLLFRATVALAGEPDYFPLQVGNKWVYSYFENGLSQGLTTELSVSGTAVIDSQLYFVLSGSALGKLFQDPSDSVLVRKDEQKPNRLLRHITVIHFSLSQTSPAELTIYNVTGQIVRTLLAGTPMPAGDHTVLWDGKDNWGNPLATGLYLYRLTAGAFTAIRKMLLVR